MIKIIVLLGMIIILLGSGGWAAFEWRRADIAYWTNAGKEECRGAVERATAEAREESIRELQAKEAAHSKTLEQLEKVKATRDQDIAAVRAQMAELEDAASRVNYAGTGKPSDNRKCRIPAPLIDILNRPIRLGTIPAPKGGVR